MDMVSGVIPRTTDATYSKEQVVGYDDVFSKSLSLSSRVLCTTV